MGGPLPDAAQAAAYLYLLLGMILIGRRWSRDQLGVNSRGLALWTEPLTALGLLGDFAFYLGAVGLTEELLFRGLIYRALEGWRGVCWAI